MPGCSAPPFARFRPVPRRLNAPLTISAPTIAPEDGRPPRPAGRQIEGARNGSGPVFWQNLGDPRGNQAAGDVCARSASAVPRHRIRRRQHAPQPQRATGPSPCRRSPPTPCGRRPISWPTSRKPTNWPRRPDSGLFRDDFPSFLIAVTAPDRHRNASIVVQFSAKGPNVGGNGDLFDQNDDHRCADLLSRGRRRRHRHSRPRQHTCGAAPTGCRFACCRPGAGVEQGKQEGPAGRRELRAGRL